MKCPTCGSTEPRLCSTSGICFDAFHKPKGTPEEETLGERISALEDSIRDLSDRVVRLLSSVPSQVLMLRNDYGSGPERWI